MGEIVYHADGMTMTGYLPRPEISGSPHSIRTIRTSEEISVRTHDASIAESPDFGTASVEFQHLPSGAKTSSPNCSACKATQHRRHNIEAPPCGGRRLGKIHQKSRCELALSLLNDRHLTIGDIATYVGFSDATAFRRAFKGWMGTSPYKYRLAIKPVQALLSNRPLPTMIRIISDLGFIDKAPERAHQ